METLQKEKKTISLLLEQFSRRMSLSTMQSSRILPSQGEWVSGNPPKFIVYLDNKTLFT